jgi:hypothetical protein
MRRSLALLVLTGAIIGLVANRDARAEPRVEADPNKDYFVFPQVGEWVVLAAHYSGPEAKELAKQMAYKLRADLNYSAYVFVYVDEERKKQQDELDRAHAFAMKLMEQSGSQPVTIRRRTIRIEEEYGVLIGGWNDINAANTALKAIKAVDQAKVPRVVSAIGATTTDTIVDMLRDKNGMPVLDKNGQPQPVRYRLNPFAKAIVTRNPSLPKQQVARKADPMIQKLNENEDFSLLKNPRKYTLLVKEYIGASRIQNTTSENDEKGFLSTIGIGGNKEGEGLDKAALDAHVVAGWLRQAHFDAYALHGRTSSAVTIGGFDSPDDPAIGRVMTQIAELRQKLLAQTKMDPLQLYSTPIPVEIPRF